ncbi:MAG: porin [Bacteroidales bacterium]|nr:porin [Bacteroidales bacterium]
MKKIVLVILFIVFLIPSLVFSQTKNDSISAMKTLLNSVEPYGTFEYALGGNRRGWAVVDIIPRIGIKGEWMIDDNPKYYVFTKAEVGLHLTRRNDFISISADPGAPGTTQSALFARQGYIGISTPYGRFSIGKMWGVHYNIAGYLDNMYMFGGDAIGVYNAGTDGGASGTGRADQAVKYEFYKGNFFFGAQLQARDISNTSRTGIDASSFATTYQIGSFLIGASYSRVFDGIENPSLGEAKINDEMGAVAINYTKGHFMVSIINIVFNNHEKDNNGVYYKGWGVEYNIKYDFGKTKAWSIVSNSSIMMPFESVGSKYIMNRYALEVARRFSINTLATLGVKFDNTYLANGKPEELTTVALGFYYNFNYPVP